MSLDQGLLLVTVVFVLVSLVRGRWGADAILLTGLGFLLVTGVVSPRDGLAGFANEGMLTVAALFVVAAGLRQSGAVGRIGGRLLGRKPSARVALARMIVPVAGASALLNNTPIVAALMPGVVEWSRRTGVPASKLLMPLSFATILGGTITVIGTSTNLVVTGLIEQRVGEVPGLYALSIFSIAPVGLLVAVSGCLLMLLCAPLLLPDRRPAISLADDPREYSTELVVAPDGPLVGRSIEDAGLRNLPGGGFLAEVARDDTVMPAVEPRTVLRGDDRLVFVGPRQAVLDLTRQPGLDLAPDARFALRSADADRCLVEAVVAPQNPLVGSSIRDGRFRETFGAVVVAAARNGRRLPGRLGDVILAAGDVLILEAHPSWPETQGSRRDFVLATTVDDSSAMRHDRAGRAVLVLAALVGAAALGLVSMFQAAVAGAAAMVLLGCVRPIDARRSIDLPTLTAIAASFGIGEGIRASGADQAVAGSLVALGADHPLAALAALYLATTVLTELITNNAAAALMFPFALSLAERLGVSPMPFAVAVMFAASASFATPIGYQTNLMVYGPGGYRFGDYLRLGLPLQLVAGLVTLAAVPVFFPF